MTMISQLKPHVQQIHQIFRGCLMVTLFSDDDESPEKEIKETEEPKDEDKKIFYLNHRRRTTKQGSQS